MEGNVLCARCNSAKAVRVFGIGVDLVVSNVVFNALPGLGCLLEANNK